MYQEIVSRQLQASRETESVNHGAYLDLVEHVTTAAPRNLQDIIRQHLLQLKNTRVPVIYNAAALNLRGDQYHAYTTVTSALRASRYSGRHFFIIGPGGTGKSYLLKSLQAWCDTSGYKSLLLAPTGIAANNVGWLSRIP